MCLGLSLGLCILLLLLDVCRMSPHLLTTFQPQGHLNIFALVVCRTVGILSEIDVKSLRLFSIVIVG